MSIVFNCGCGKKYQVADNHAGKRTKCPACGQVLKVPEPEQPSEGGLLDELGPEEWESERTADRPLPTASYRSLKQPDPNFKLLVGASTNHLELQ